MLHELTDLLRAVRIADVLDVAFISVLLYTVLTWLRETTSRSVYVGISILALVYLLARMFDMYLTTLAFRAVFAVLLVALVVVFQEDLRRLLERFATYGAPGHRRQRATTFPHIDTFVELASELASKKIGCLIVIKGRDPLDRHVEGGILVDGRISKPLLESIFDPHSMGHDGAVVIEDNRIKHIAAHLPLSKNLKGLGSRGTRHGAALGLSERSDALVIVVSEERGQISVAEAGKLKVMTSPAELQSRLDQFSGQKLPSPAEETWKRFVKKHAALKVVSVVLACVAWFAFSYQTGTVQQVFRMPVEFRNVPEDLVFENPPTEVNVTLSGREREFDLLAPSTLKVSLDLAELEEGSYQMPLQDEHVKRPAGLDVYLIEPRVLQFEGHRQEPAELPIDVQTVSRLPEGVELKRIQPVPPSVDVLVWRSELERTKRLKTEPIDLSRITKTTTVDATLILPRHVRFASAQPPKVQVTIEVVTTQAERSQKVGMVASQGTGAVSARR